MQYHNHRNNVGQFAKKSNTLRNIMIVLFVVAAVFIVNNIFTRPVEYKNVEVEKIVEIDRSPKILAEMKTEVMDTLETCESQGQDVSNFKDGNARTAPKDVASYGRFMWKISSIQAEVNRRDNSNISDNDAIRLALDYDQAKALAYFTIFEAQDGPKIRRWENCMNKHGLFNKVTMIKEFESRVKK
jgi:hypothetical protein